MTSPTIFLSYGHHDQSWCEELAAHIRGNGFDLWYDEGITSGSAWLKKLEDELQARDIFLIVLSPEGWASAWVQRELQLALITQKTIIPIVLRETAIGGFLLTIQWIDVIGMTPQAAGQRIIANLSVPASVSAPQNLPTTVIQPRAVPAATPSRLFIWSIDNADTPRCVTMFRHRLTIGRERDNDIVLNDPAVSRHHAEFDLEPEGWCLRRHSEGGMVYYNGRPLDEAKLKTFDQIVLGMTLMRIEIPSPRSNVTLSTVPILLVDCPECHFMAPLREPELVVGRAPESDLVIPAPIISHTAGRLRREPSGSYTLYRITNRNSVRFGEAQIEQHTFADDDRVIIGDESVHSMVILRYATAVL